ncbi:MAG TPA: hypothetical protein VN628_09510 [Vicinamibacterales bacterium]|nr:hypothetical protein [Vicinamibacterales bacterium]
MLYRRAEVFMANVAKASMTTTPEATSRSLARALSPVDSFFALGAAILVIAIVSGFFLK